MKHCSQIRNTRRSLLLGAASLAIVLMVGLDHAVATPAKDAVATTSSERGITASGKQGNNGILDQVSALYSTYKTIQADFTFHYYRNEQDQTGQSEKGKLLLDQSNGKYRISTHSQELISDGQSQWAVLREADEVQITEVGGQEESITPFNIFSFFKQGYSQNPLPAEKVGNQTLDVIELTPTDSRKNFSKIIVRVARSSKHLHDVTIFDKNKSRYSYRILNLVANPALANNQFVFNKNEFPGMEIVDLR